jgi:uncharacterized protein
MALLPRESRCVGRTIAAGCAAVNGSGALGGASAAILAGVHRDAPEHEIEEARTMPRRDGRGVARDLVAWWRWWAIAAGALGAAAITLPALAQVPPSATERAGYSGLFAAAARGDAAVITALTAAGSKPDARDARGRTPLHVAAYGGHRGAMAALVAAGADPNALEGDRYDVVTIAAVANDVPTLEAALAQGASAKNVTSPYDGTALIAAAHLGHAEVVRVLIRAGAPLDHVNNLGWTAVIESIVLGDGGRRHVATLRALVEAGADVNLADRGGQTPLALAGARGYAEMAQVLRRAGAR